MGDDPETPFRIAFEQLPAEQQVAFVEALYREQGWAVDIDGRQLHLTDGETAQTLYIGPRSRASTADVVVPVASTTGDVIAALKQPFSGSEAAPDAAPTELSVDELKQQLLYAVERDRATELTESFFDRSLDSLTGTASDDSPREADPDTDWQLSPRIAVVALVLLALSLGVAALAVGPAGVFDAPGADAETETDTLSAESEESAGPADGETDTSSDELIVTTTDNGEAATEQDQQATWIEDGQADLDVLSDQHLSAVSEISNATLMLEYEGPSSVIDFEAAEPIGNDRARAVYEAGAADPDLQANGDLAHHSGAGPAIDASIVTLIDDPAPVVPAPKTVLDERGFSLLRTYLDAGNQFAVPLDGDQGQAVFDEDADGLYTIFANEPPETVADTVSEFDASGLVTADGLIREFRVSYRVDGERVTIGFQIES